MSRRTKNRNFTTLLWVIVHIVMTLATGGIWLLGLGIWALVKYNRSH